MAFVEVAHWCLDQTVNTYGSPPSLGALQAYPEPPLKFLLLLGDCEQLQGYVAFTSYCICFNLHLLQTCAPESRSGMLNLTSGQGPLNKLQPQPSQEHLLFDLLNLKPEW